MKIDAENIQSRLQSVCQLIGIGANDFAAGDAASSLTTLDEAADMLDECLRLVEELDREPA